MKTENKETKLQGLINYIKEAKEEIDKVIFPDRTQVKGAFISVFVVVTFITILLAVFDVLVSFLISSLL